MAKIQSLQLKIDAFEGPLDVLLHLILKNRLDIYNIPIAQIANQYIEYLGDMQSQNLDIASEFVAMAAHLLYIKSKMLLPKSSADEQDDPRSELVERLLEYKKYKDAAQDTLQQRQDIGTNRYFRVPVKLPHDKTLLPLDVKIERLTRAFEMLLSRNFKKAPPPATSFEKIVERELFSVSQMAEIVVQRLKREKNIKFSDLFESGMKKGKMVATFIAILDLVKAGKVEITLDAFEIYLTEVAS